LLPCAVENGFQQRRLSLSSSSKSIIMNCKNIFVTILGTCLFVAAACNSNSGTNQNGGDATSADNNAGGSAGTDPKGIGPIKNVQLTHPLDEKMVADGKNQYDVKCASCHKLTDERLVGPGWKGVTDRRTPEWIMNFTVNTEEMVEKDTAVQNMLEVCLVKMPNQGLSEADARHVLEYMRKNDGKQ
jgi:mono/diheme cytochrome c family protein